MAPTCRSRKPASTRAASARSMKAKPSRCRAARVRPPAPKTRPTRPNIPPSINGLPSDHLRGHVFWRHVFWRHALARLLVEPALEHAHIADVGAEHDVEGVARHRHQPDHAIDSDIA